MELTILSQDLSKTLGAFKKSVYIDTRKDNRTYIINKNIALYTNIVAGLIPHVYMLIVERTGFVRRGVQRAVPLEPTALLM